MPLRSLSLLALVFVLIFALQLVGVLLPFQPNAARTQSVMTPAWERACSLCGLPKGSPGVPSG
jgi:hypothetical protein